MFDYNNLREKIYGRKFRNQTRFAKAMGMSKSTLCQKLEGKYPFTVDEVDKAMELLEIPKEKILDYFFIRG